MSPENSQPSPQKTLDTRALDAADALIHLSKIKKSLKSTLAEVNAKQKEIASDLFEGNLGDICQQAKAVHDAEQEISQEEWDKVNFLLDTEYDPHDWPDNWIDDDKRKLGVK